MKWPLNDSNFTFLDRLKICNFFLNPKNFWTMTDEVRKFESKMERYVGCKHAVFVSSGSTANTLLAMYLKDKVFSKTRNTIVFPSTTWITSVSPFLREGFKPHFIDINLKDLSINIDDLDKYLAKNNKKVACVFVTSLLGFVPSIDKLLALSKKYKVRIMMDNCESTFSWYNSHNISYYFTSTTSTYFGHNLQSVEGGFVFTNSDEEYEYFLMARNHGMVRSLTDNKEKYSNPDVDSRFDFNLLGNNFRNTNINAFIGQLDFKRIKKYEADRCKLYHAFETAAFNAPQLKVIERNFITYFDIPFCIPLIFNNVRVKSDTLNYCHANGIETRPIISGNLLRQTCLKPYKFNPVNFKNSEYLHIHGFYVGLHSKVKVKDILDLVKYIKVQDAI